MDIITLCIAAFVLCVIIIAKLLQMKKKKTKETEETDMPHGLQVRNANGQIILDTNDRISKIVGEVDINPTASRTITSGTVYGGIGEGTLWYIITHVYTGSASSPSTGTNSINLPVITQISGGFKWEYKADFSNPNAYPAGVHVIYGVY